MSEYEYTLRFHGPFVLCRGNEEILFGASVSSSSGVYLWTVPFREGGFLVLYIGETGDPFRVRFKDHIVQMIGGNYRISDPDRLVEGIDQSIWNGLWRKGTRDQAALYADRFVELAPIIKKNIDLARIFLAPLEGERRLRRRLELALAKHIRAQPEPACSLLPGDVRYVGERFAHEAMVRAEVVCESRVLGLPRSVAA
jgi:hypothetical protein